MEAAAAMVMVMVTQTGRGKYYDLWFAKELICFCCSRFLI